MADSRHPALSRLLRTLLATGAAFVPSSQRADWRAEWEAEILYARRRGIADRVLATRLLGGIVHAAWLRRRWSSHGLAAMADAVALDLRDASRTLIRRPAVTAAAVITLALGIGANTAIFSVLSSVLLRPLPFRDAGHLVVLWPERTDAVSRPESLDLRSSLETVPALAAVNGRSSFSLTGAGDPARVEGVFASVNLFDVLGVQAALGRTFAAGEDQPGRDAVVILSHGLWQRRFGGERAVIGRTLTLEGAERTIVGVLPADVRLPSASTELWVPLPLYQNQPRTGRGPSWQAQYFTLVGRLGEAVGVERATAELRTVAAALHARAPGFVTADAAARATVVSLHEHVTGGARAVLGALMSAVGLILLIACVNVGNLLLVRGADRQRDFAVRAALGANRRRLLRQVLVEYALLAAAGGAAGLMLAVLLVRTLAGLIPPGFPRAADVSLDLSAVAFTAAATGACVFLFGLVPAVRSTRSVAPLTGDGRSVGTTVRVARLRRVLVAFEVALAIVLMTGATLMLRSLWHLSNVDPGFRAERVLSMRVTPGGGRYRTDDQQRALYDGLLARAAGLPGVEAVGAIQHAPLGGSNWTMPVRVFGRPVVTDATAPMADYRIITPGYFETLQVPLRRGRAFTSDDSEDAPPVAIVSERFARTLWPGGEPIGQRISTPLGGGFSTWVEVVGVAGDVHARGLGSEARSELYRPFRQVPNADMTLLIRTAGDGRAAASSLRSVAWQLDKDLPFSDIRSMEDAVSASVAQPRFTALLLAALAALALSLGAIGLYGMLAYAVAQRRREVGLRLALGASRGQILRLVLSQALSVTGAGIAAGLAAAALAGRTLSTLLFEVQPWDPITFVTVPVVLFAVALVAAWLPARRATRVDPAVALRVE